MTFEAALSRAMDFLRIFIRFALGLVIAITAAELLGFNVPGINGIPLTQTAGIGAAGLGFLYSKL